MHSNHQLPVRLLGVSTVYPGSLASTVRVLDPFFFQGGDPATNAGHWFSFLDSPDSSGRGDDSRDCQILVSWPYRSGFLECEEPLEVPAQSSDRIALMKKISSTWADPFHSIVHSIPDGIEAKPISLEDWVPPPDHWNDITGSDRVVLVGDAAHAMTMYRGEAANHGIVDVDLFLSETLPALTSDDENRTKLLSKACKGYTQQMVERAAPAVLKSRQACLDAHVYERINDDSPLIAKRVAKHESSATDCGS